MTRSENMKRLWADPAFRARRSAQARAHMAALAQRQWADPAYRAQASERVRLWNKARHAERDARRADYLGTFVVKQPQDP